MAEQFGKVPTAMVTAGGLRQMRGGDAAVYLAIASHTRRDMQATIGQRKIADLAGLFIGRVNESIKRLAKAELIEVTEKGSGRRPSTFRLCVPHTPNATGGDSVPIEPNATDAQRSGHGAVAFRKSSRSVPAGPEQIRESERSESAPGNGQPADGDPVMFTFTTRDGKPWKLHQRKLHELRDGFPFVHVDSELAGLSDWTARNPERAPAPAGVWSWLRKLLAKKQGERPLPEPAFYADGYAHTSLPTDPTGPEVDALFAED